jgi:uncharacterized membrane protein
MVALMGHIKPQLQGLASALILAGLLAACKDNRTVTVQYTSEDRGIKMPAPKLSDRERCYGIAKAQYNDGTAGCDDCAGTALKDYMPDTWKYVPTGQCTGLGGSLIAGKASK